MTTFSFNLSIKLYFKKLFLKLEKSPYIIKNTVILEIVVYMKGE